MKKKGVELAINTVIITTLALLVLVVGVFLVKNLLIDHELPELEPPFMASQNNPLVLDDTAVGAGRSEDVLIDFYNTERRAVTREQAPTIACLDNDGIALRAMGLDVEPYEGKRYEALLVVEEDASPGRYPCTVTLSQTQAQAIITVT